jgi:UDP-glucose 4-epimerase
MAEPSQPDYTAFRGKEVLITGGLGFIGSSLAIELCKHGARVTLVDAMLPDLGGNVFNIEPVREDVRINYCDIRDEHSINHLVGGMDFVFHFAGQNSHVLSLTNPFPDIDMNIKGTAVVLEACKKFAPNAKLIYSGTRGQYGRGIQLPVAEDAPTNPLGIYEVSRLAAEKMVQVYHDTHKIEAVMLRLTNIYGPRSQMLHNRFGVANWFIRQALDEECISVYGDGSLIRDFLYIDDCIDAMLRCALVPEAAGEVLNVGNNEAHTFLELVQLVVDTAEVGSWEFTPFSQERAKAEPGHFYSDISKITRLTGWCPKTSLANGIATTVAYYKRYRRQYWTTEAV